MKNNYGFMKIKLLAVVFIIGIICLLFLPKSITYFNNRKKEKYIEVALSYITEVKESINSLEYKQIPLENEALLIPLTNLKTNKASPYGAFKDDYSYVIVVHNDNFYDYYFASIDTSKHGIPIVNERELNIDSVIYGESNLTSINKISAISNLYVNGTIYKKSDETREDDKNILLIPASGDLTVSYEFKADVHKIYDNLIKNIDTNIYNKEVTMNNGVLKYNNYVIASDYAKDINGVFRYISFPDGDDFKYYAGFVTYTKSYVAGVINESNNYSSKNMVFDSVPAIVINQDASIVIDNNQKYLMWNLMAIYPDNDNYTITECGAIMLKNNDATNVKLDFDTENILIGKSNNNCELGNIFAIRKDNIQTNDRWFAKGYIKYQDKDGNEYISYSNYTISALVK